MLHIGTPIYNIWGMGGGALTNLFDKRYRIIHYGILTERICMLFIIPVILLNVCAILVSVVGHPLFGLGLCVLSFLYIAKQFID